MLPNLRKLVRGVGHDNGDIVPPTDPSPALREGRSGVARPRELEPFRRYVGARAPYGDGSEGPAVLLDILEGEVDGFAVAQFAVAVCLDR